MLATLLFTGLANAQQYTVGSMIWDTTVPFYSNLIKGEQDAAKKYGINLLLRNGQGELAQEIAVIQQFVAQHVDLILVTPSDAEGIVPAIKKANEANIPVIQVNNRVGKGAQTVTFVGADDTNFGEQQGQLLVNAIGDSGNVALILGKLGTSAQLLRLQGLQAFLKNYPNIKLVTQTAADWDPSKALAATQDFLNKYPQGSLDAIVDQGPEGVSGARFAKQNGRPDVKFILGDYPSDVKKAISDGIVYGTVDQDPYPQGYDGVQYAYYYLTGQQSKIPTPNAYEHLPLVTKDNVDQYPAAW